MQKKKKKQLYPLARLNPNACAVKAYDQVNELGKAIMDEVTEILDIAFPENKDQTHQGYRQVEGTAQAADRPISPN